MKGYDNLNRGGKKTKVGGTEKKDIPTCDTCGKNHGGAYHKKIGACFKCGKSGHFVQNCPDAKEDQWGTHQDRRVQG